MRVKRNQEKHAEALWKYCDSISKEEYEKLKEESDRKERIINQIDDILEKIFGVRHDIAKPNEFEKNLKEKIENYEKEIHELKIENAELHCEMQAMNIFCEGTPEEPIKVADMLISATYTRNKNEIEKNIGKAFGNNSDTVTENVYSASELRQIAEHILVYCNANGEEER